MKKNPGLKGKSLKEVLQYILPDYARLPLVFTVICNVAVYYGSQYITAGWPHHMIDTPFDSWMPFVPWTASVYLGCYLFWIINYILSARQSKEMAYRFLSAELLAKTVCFLFFVVYPTTNIRPEVGQEGFWNGAMRMIYDSDSPVNLFPSIHCLVSWFCYLGIRRDRAIPKAYRIFSFWFAAAVFISTMTTKQHVILDVFGGVIIASACYHITDAIGFTKLYTRFFDWLHSLAGAAGDKLQKDC